MWSVFSGDVFLFDNGFDFDGVHHRRRRRVLSFHSTVRVTERLGCVCERRNMWEVRALLTFIFFYLVGEELRVWWTIT